MSTQRCGQSVHQVMSLWHRSMHRWHHLIQFSVVQVTHHEPSDFQTGQTVELNGLLTGGTMPTFANSAMVEPISSCPPGRWYSLTEVTLQGVSKNCGGCFVYSLTTAFITCTRRWNSPTKVSNIRPHGASTPQIYPGSGIYTKYTST